MQKPVQISVIVLAHGVEAHLADCVEAILASVDSDGMPVDVELILVDNGAGAAIARLGTDPRIRIHRPSQNTGFAGGCNIAATLARGQQLVFVNSDAIVDAAAISALTDALVDDTVGIVSGSVRLASDPNLMNTAGNPVHYLGLVWAGGFGDSYLAHQAPADIASITGAFFAIRHDRWLDLGGFDERYFAYHEDAELSLRIWQRGYRVRYVPSAVAVHFYEFSRNPTKQYLVERNRWITVLTVYPWQALVGVLPAAVVFELLVCAAALAQGWLPDKLRTYRWLLTNRAYLRRRRRDVQSENTMLPVDFVRLLSSRIDANGLDRPPGLAVLNLALQAYWSVFRRVSPIGR